MIQLNPDVILIYIRGFFYQQLLCHLEICPIMEVKYIMNGFHIAFKNIATC